MKVINTWAEVPDFTDREDEAKFWSEHSLSGKLLANSRHDSDGKEIKRMARSRYLNYQSMIKQWLSERLEEEVRKASSDNPPSDKP